MDEDDQVLRVSAGRVTKDWVCLYYAELLEQTMAEIGLANYKIDWQMTDEQPVEQPIGEDAADDPLIFLTQNGPASMPLSSNRSQFIDIEPADSKNKSTFFFCIFKGYQSICSFTTL